MAALSIIAACFVEVETGTVAAKIVAGCLNVPVIGSSAFGIAGCILEVPVAHSLVSLRSMPASAVDVPLACAKLAQTDGVIAVEDLTFPNRSWPSAAAGCT